jgi:hypothetical protein
MFSKLQRTILSVEMSKKNTFKVQRTALFGKDYGALHLEKRIFRHCYQ